MNAKDNTVVTAQRVQYFNIKMRNKRVFLILLHLLQECMHRRVKQQTGHNFFCYYPHQLSGL